MLKTKMITYNVHDRGRKALGVDRLFDTVALAKLINGPAVQERVKLGDLKGYYGHLPRQIFGMATREVGFLDGQAVAMPIALRTTYLSADDQGNITHQAEFLDTVWGKEAAANYESQSGGFSSAIDVASRGSPSIPTDFHGFDYVLEPNYTTNRGHRAMLDAVAAGGVQTDDLVALLDAAMADSAAMLTNKNALFDSLAAQHRMALDALERVSRENDLLISRLASEAMLDDVRGEERAAPARGGATADDFARFRNMPLVELQKLDDGRSGGPVPGDAYLRHYGMKG